MKSAKFVLVILALLMLSACNHAAEPEPAATIEPIEFTATSLPPTPKESAEILAYSSEFKRRAVEVGNSFADFDASLDILSDPDKLRDSGLRINAIQKLQIWANTVEELASIEPVPEKFESLKYWLDKMSSQAKETSDLFNKGLTTLDGIVINEAGASLGKYSNYVDAARDELMQIGFAEIFPQSNDE